MTSSVEKLAGIIKSVVLSSALVALPSVAAGPPEDTAFLDFPMVNSVSAARAPAIAWLIRQGGQTKVMFARGPEFKPIQLYARPDADGEPVAEIRLSPDGGQVAFVTGVAMPGRDEGYNPASLIDPPRPIVWLIKTRAGAMPTKIGIGTSPLFTPNGRLLTFRRGRDLWSKQARNRDTATVLIAGGASFIHPIWTPDGKSLFFVQDRGGWSSLGRYDIGSDRIRWIVTGPGRLGSPTLSPDGKSIAYFRWPARQHGVSYDEYENELVSLETVDVQASTISSLWHSTNPAGIQVSNDDTSNLRWADDRNIIFRAEPDGWARLYAINRTGGAPRALTRANCEVAESALIAPDVLFVIHNCGDLDTRRLSTVDIRTGAERSLDSNDTVLANALAIQDGRWVAYTGAGSSEPSLLRILDIRTRKLVYSEHAASYGYTYRFAAPPPQVVSFTAADGTRVSGQLFLPNGNGAHPAIVFAHGGPKEQMFPGFHFQSYYAYDYAMNRRFAELGYAVLSVNFRSSTGYGQSFREAKGRAWRNASDYQDIIAARQFLASQSDVDPSRIGIWGTSYGGFLAALGLARNSDLFAAGVAVHGVFDWSWSSGLPDRPNPTKAFGVGQAEKATAFEASPVAAINTWKSPVLLLAGDQDMNVDMLETVNLARKLADQGVPARTVVIPGEAHRMIRHSSWVRLWTEQMRFLNERLAPHFTIAP